MRWKHVAVSKFIKLIWMGWGATGGLRVKKKTLLFCFHSVVESFASEQGKAHTHTHRTHRFGPYHIELNVSAIIRQRQVQFLTMSKINSIFETHPYECERWQTRTQTLYLAYLLVFRAASLIRWCTFSHFVDKKWALWVSQEVINEVVMWKYYAHVSVLISFYLSILLVVLRFQPQCEI